MTDSDRRHGFGLFGQAGLAGVALKSLLASITLAAAGMQVALALWLYRKLPLAGSPQRPVRLAHRITGFALFALTVPLGQSDGWAGSADGSGQADAGQCQHRHRGEPGDPGEGDDF